MANDNFLNFHVRPDKKDFFFDRDPVIFNSILTYLWTGSLHLPSSMCAKSVQDELRFWGVDEAMIDDCCWDTYFNSLDNLKVSVFFSIHC